jgi:hypothetical protein
VTLVDSGEARFAFFEHRKASNDLTTVTSQ